MFLLLYSAAVVFRNLLKYNEYRLYVRSIAIQSFLLAKDPLEKIQGEDSRAVPIITLEDGLFSFFVNPFLSLISILPKENHLKCTIISYPFHIFIYYMQYNSQLI